MKNKTDSIFRWGYIIPGDLYRDMKALAKKENLKLQNVFAQFIYIYTEFLDASFVQHKERSRKEKAYSILYIQEELLKRFIEKLEWENLKAEAVLQQFMLNYLAYWKMKDKVKF